MKLAKGEGGVVGTLQASMSAGAAAAKAAESEAMMIVVRILEGCVDWCGLDGRS